MDLPIDRQRLRGWDEMYTEEGILEMWASITSVLGRKRLGKVEGFGTVGLTSLRFCTGL